MLPRVTEGEGERHISVSLYQRFKGAKGLGHKPRGLGDLGDLGRYWPRTLGFSSCEMWRAGCGLQGLAEIGSRPWPGDKRLSSFSVTLPPALLGTAAWETRSLLTLESPFS